MISVLTELSEGVPEEVVENGRRFVRNHRPSADFPAKSLSRLTVSFIYDEKGKETVVYSNFEPVNTEIMGILDEMEADSDPVSGKKWVKSG